MHYHQNKNNKNRFYASIHAFSFKKLKNIIRGIIVQGK